MATNLFGSFNLDVKVPDAILVPTGKSILPGPPPPPPAPDADHYLCHKVEVNSQPDLKNIDLTLVTQFTAPNTFKNNLATVDRLCVAVSKNGVPITNPCSPT